MDPKSEPVQPALLLVEDDPNIRESLRRYFEHQGFRVREAAEATTGLELAGLDHFDVVVSDVMMPRMNGLALLDELMQRTGGVPVVMITGYADLKVAVEAMKRGASDFVTKPFAFDELERVVRDAIDGKGARRPAATCGASDCAGELEDRIRELTALYETSDPVSDAQDEDVFQFLVDMAQRLTSSRRAQFFVCDPDTRTFYRKAWAGPDRPKGGSSPFEFEADVVDRVFGATRPLHLSGREACHLMAGGESDGDRADCETIAAPLIVRGEVFGILAVHKLGGARFDPADPSFLQILLRKAAMQIENTALYESLYNNLVNTLNSLVHAIEAKDPYTRYHSQRVTSFSCGIAEAMGLSERELESLRFAAPLHDIGKIGISDTILQKVGKPTNEEFAAIKTHPTLGAKILEPLGLLPAEKAIVLHHHERWDGAGYPDGMAGEDIPLLARIVTVADAYDAMTSDRIYRKALSHEQAIAELEGQAEAQFDKRVVSAMLTYCETEGIE